MAERVGFEPATILPPARRPVPGMGIGGRGAPAALLILKEAGLSAANRRRPHAPLPVPRSGKRLMQPDKALPVGASLRLTPVRHPSSVRAWDRLSCSWSKDRVPLDLLFEQLAVADCDDMKSPVLKRLAHLVIMRRSPWLVM